MNQRGRISVVVLFVVLAAALLWVPFYGSAVGKGHPASKRPEPKLRIGITSVYAKSKLSVPVLRADARPYMSVIRIPENETGADSTRASAIKMVPYLTEKGEVKVEVSLLFGDVSSITSCEQYKKLKEQPVASYVSRKGEKKISAADLRKFGIEPISFSLDETDGDGGEPEGGCNGCQCGSLCCQPNPGYCMGCGSCGLCCRIIICGTFPCGM